MKKIMALMLAVTLVFASCSKERKLNRKLDGEWTLSTIDGVPPSNPTATISFNKDKKEGTYNFILSYKSGISVIISGNYSLTKDETITLTPTDLTNFDVAVFTVTAYDKTDLTLTEKKDGEVWKLKKK